MGQKILTIGGLAIFFGGMGIYAWSEYDSNGHRGTITEYISYAMWAIGAIMCALSFAGVGGGKK